MSVALGLGGMAGWRLLQRTGTAAVERFATNPQIARARSQFEGASDKYGSAEALVGDYNALKVALTAFGLEGDINNKAFIRKVLDSDLRDGKSLANRLSDKRYLKLAQGFGLGPGSVKPKAETVATLVGNAYVEHAFELAVGETDPNLRLALSAKRELTLLANRTSTEATKWYTILGSSPLRKVIEGALGLPSSAVKAPLERQIEMFSDAAQSRIGSDFFGKLKDPKTIDTLIDAFLARSGATATGVGYNSPYAGALMILSA